MPLFLVAVGLTPLVLGTPPAPVPASYFTIEVLDAQTGRGVPLVELETVNNLRYVTDSNGLAAFYEPGLMGQTVFFHVRSDGYEVEKDGFGYRGKALKVVEGGSARIAIRRVNVAERLYRITGEGIYHDSVLLGRAAPIRNPVLNGQVLGQDSVVNAVYHGRLYWFWGDTNRPGNPLGNFNVSGATSLLPADGGLDPAKGVDLTYFVRPDGFAKEMAPMPGPGPTWIFGLTVVRDRAGREHMVAGYAKVRNNMEAYERGLVEYDDETQQFRKVAQFDLHAPDYPRGQTFQRSEGGQEYVYFCEPYPLTRVPADPERMRDPSAYEAYTCLKEGTRCEQGELDRAADGSLRYSWKKNTPPVGPRDQVELIKAGKMRPEEGLLHLQDVDSGKAVLAHSGSVQWNAFRKRWVMIAVEQFGTSMLGELWYAEADTPLGPWAYARKIVTHDRYSFYNPTQHPEFDQEGGRLIYFEGTYTATFSGNPVQTPRYNYNQIMYRLDLADPRLNLPVPVYGGDARRESGGRGDVREPQEAEGGGGARHMLPGRGSKPYGLVAPVHAHTAAALDQARRAGPVPFFALERPGEGTVALYAQADGTLGLAENDKPILFALPADAPNPPATSVPLYEYSAGGGKRFYAVEGAPVPEGFQRAGRPLCRVWHSPAAF
jgi:hypothetical protein